MSSTCPAGLQTLNLFAFAAILMTNEATLNALRPMEVFDLKSYFIMAANIIAYPFYDFKKSNISNIKIHLKSAC